MTITTRGGKQTIDPPMPSTEENVRNYNDNVVKGSGEAEENNGKDAEVPMKVIPMPRPPPPFPQRLVKKTEDGKYRRFITMLKQLSINVSFGRSSRTNARLCQIYERSGHQEKIDHF